MSTFVWGLVLEPRRVPLRIEAPHDRECFDFLIVKLDQFQHSKNLVSDHVV